jgi:hypothetical protein
MFLLIDLADFVHVIDNLFVIDVRHDFSLVMFLDKIPKNTLLFHEKFENCRQIDEIRR